MRYFKFLSIVFFALSSVISCKVNATNKSIRIIINNNTNLNFSDLECFSCKTFLSENIYSDTKTKVHFIYKDALYINSDGSNDIAFGLLTINPQSDDSLWINIELFRVTKKSDTLRIANFGGRTITKDKNTVNNIKSDLCKFLNK